MRGAGAGISPQARAQGDGSGRGGRGAARRGAHQTGGGVIFDRALFVSRALNVTRRALPRAAGSRQDIVRRLQCVTWVVGPRYIANQRSVRRCPAHCDSAGMLSRIVTDGDGRDARDPPFGAADGFSPITSQGDTDRIDLCAGWSRSDERAHPQQRAHLPPHWVIRDCGIGGCGISFRTTSPPPVSLAKRTGTSLTSPRCPAVDHYGSDYGQQSAGQAHDSSGGRSPASRSSGLREYGQIPGSDCRGRTSEERG